jgi:hypothetical protein
MKIQDKKNNMKIESHYGLIMNVWNQHNTGLSYANYFFGPVGQCNKKQFGGIPCKTQLT